MMSLVFFGAFIVFYLFCDLTYQDRWLAVVYRYCTFGYHFIGERSSLSWPVSSLFPAFTLTLSYWSFLPFLLFSFPFVTLPGYWLLRQLQLYCGLLWWSFCPSANWGRGGSIGFGGYSGYGGFSGYSSCGGYGG